ncbi:MAG TPA: glycosyltransferase family 4 protein [Acidimicrobiales bacterium]|nr:glycosyltransferase family 4 protein [Acidimicrobiales bacterium]
MAASPHATNIAKIGDLAAAAGLRRIHLLSWRDLDDVEAGGSEVHAATVARFWAEAGLDVTLRTSYAQGQAPVVVRDGYRVIRRAGRYLVFPRAIASELIGRHGPRDALVEIWNGMPFFSPLWATGPRIVVLHHVHAEMWKMVLGDDAPWAATMGDLIERRLAPLAYKRSRVVTLSHSSKHDIVEMLGFRPERVDVVSPGVDPVFTPAGDKAAKPLVVAVGRLVPVKRYDHLIRSVARARAQQPDIELTIVGEGYERPRLEEVVREVDGTEWVTLSGHVSESELVALYRRAWVVASASAREGWGMSLTEAAACATPAVATDIAGHRDAVVSGESGVLVERDDEDAFAGGIARVLRDEALRARLTSGALAHAARFTWEATATGVMRALAAEAQRRATR